MNDAVLELNVKSDVTTVYVISTLVPAGNQAECRKTMPFLPG